MLLFIAQTIGIAAMILSFISFQCKNQKLFFIFQALSGLLFSLNFYLLGALTGSVLNLINIFRGFSFAFLSEKIKYSFIALLFSALFITSTILTYDGTLSLIVLAAQLISTISMGTRSNKIIRINQLLFVSPLWLTYNIFVASAGGILCESFNIISVIVFIARHGVKNLK